MTCTSGDNVRQRWLPKLHNEPLTTVAIITRNRPRLLEECLYSISTATYPRKEILVVDSSSPRLARKMENLAREYQCRYVHESRRGRVIARNTALRESKGEIIAFVDDDCVVHPEWLGRLVRNYTTPSIACVTGRILPKSTKKVTALGDFFDMDFGPNRHVYTKHSTSKTILKLVSIGMTTGPLGQRAPFPWGMGSGANMSIRKEILKATGLFDLNLWPDYPGEDLDMHIRILDTGFQLVYEPTALVYHEYGLSDKRTWPGELAYRHGVGTGTLLLKYVSDPYFFALYFGRIFNVLYQIVRGIFRRDKEYCVIRCSYLRGLLYGLRLWLSDI